MELPFAVPPSTDDGNVDDSSHASFSNEGYYKAGTAEWPLAEQIRMEDSSSSLADPTLLEMSLRTVNSLAGSKNNFDSALRNPPLDSLPLEAGVCGEQLEAEETPLLGEETVDFADTFVTVSSVEELDAKEEKQEAEESPNTPKKDQGNSWRRWYGGDVLTLLLVANDDEEEDENVSPTSSFVSGCDAASTAAREAIAAKRRGDVESAITSHTTSARIFRDGALSIHQRNPSLAYSLLLLSNAQARSATALQSVVPARVKLDNKKSPVAANLEPITTPLTLAPTGTVPSTPPASKSPTPSKTPKAQTSPSFRLLAKIRGALGDETKEADMSDSVFVAPKKKQPSSDSHANQASDAPSMFPSKATPLPAPTTSPKSNSTSNSVDEMMELERELRDMDMALEMGSSVASLGQTRGTRVRMGEDGSYCVVPEGQASQQQQLLTGADENTRQQNLQPPREIRMAPARRGKSKNRVKEILDSSAAAGAAANLKALSIPEQQQTQQTAVRHPSLQSSASGKKTATPAMEASWWGQGSLMSQMSSSQLSVSSRGSGGGLSVLGLLGASGGAGAATAGESKRKSGGKDTPANAKELIPLLETLKRLGDENASLLREVEDAQAARHEAQAAREEMKKFKAEYRKRFSKLSSDLEKFRKQYPPTPNGETASVPNPVAASEFGKSAVSPSEVANRDERIRKLEAALRKEREESQKKDAALRRYENFYREVRKRSARRAEQREQQQQQQPSRQGNPQEQLLNRLNHHSGNNRLPPTYSSRR